MTLDLLQTTSDTGYFPHDEMPGPVPVPLIALSGWMNQQQLQLIDKRREENQVLREPLGQRRLRFDDNQRADWLPGPRDWEASFIEKWLRLPRPRPFWPGIAG